MEAREDRSDLLLWYSKGFSFLKEVKLLQKCQNKKMQSQFALYIFSFSVLQIPKMYGSPLRHHALSKANGYLKRAIPFVVFSIFSLYFDIYRFSFAVNLICITLVLTVQV